MRYNKKMPQRKYLFIALLIALVIFGVITFNKLNNTYSKPVGIFAVKALDSNNLLFSDSTYSNPNITGVAVRVSWDNLEPQDNGFNWGFLDTVFQKATANGKKVIIIPIPGFDTPAWALKGVQTANFSRKYGRNAGEIKPLPIPWDQTYLSRWFNFLKRLSQRYGDNPAFIIIATSGPTSMSAEMSLPNTQQDIRQWIDLGYKPSKYLDAWKQTFIQYSQIFPKQFFSLALYPGLPINEQGQFDQSASSLTRQAVIDLAVKTYPNQFALQTSGLNASKTSGAGYEIVLNYNGKIVTGFQMSTSASVKPTKMGVATDPANALKLSIVKGTQPNQSGKIVDYLQIYETDIDNPEMQSILSYGQQLLTTGKASPPNLPNNRTNKKQQNTNQIDDSDTEVTY